MTDKLPEAYGATPATGAVGSLVERGVRPFATRVEWRSDQGGSWQQWHDDDDPMPTEWEASPPDEVVHVYSAEQVQSLLAAERERLREEIARHMALRRAVEWILEEGHMNQELLARLRAAWEWA